MRSGRYKEKVYKTFLSQGNLNKTQTEFFGKKIYKKYFLTLNLGKVI